MLNTVAIVGFVGFCERYEEILQEWEDEAQREVVLDSLKAHCEVRRGRPAAARLSIRAPLCQRG